MAPARGRVRLGTLALAGAIAAGIAGSFSGFNAAEARWASRAFAIQAEFGSTRGRIATSRWAAGALAAGAPPRSRREDAPKFRAGGNAANSEEGKMAPLSATLNLVKNIMGSGVLSLAAGVAAFSNNPSAWFPAAALLVTPLGLLSGYSFFLWGKLCEETGSDSVGEAWATRIGSKSGALISLSCTLECFVGCVLYTMILGDACHLLLGGAVPSFLSSRSSSILLLSIFVLYPLSRVKNLAPLAKFSMIGTVGLVYTTFFVILRFFQGAYASDGIFAGLGKVGVLTTSSSPHLNINAMLLSSMLSTSYMAHFNAPSFYRQLRSPKTGSHPAARLQRFRAVVFAAFGCTILLNTLVMSFGYLTFGSAAQGNILDNYAVKDAMATFARVAVALSVLFGHPFQFVGYRDGVSQLIGRPVGPMAQVVLLAATVIVALLARDLGIAQALKGCLVSVFLIFIAPAIMEVVASKSRSSRMAHAVMAFVGIGLGASGFVVAMGACLR